MNLLELPVVARTRRNHGLEHATVHVLTQRSPHRHLIGRSTAEGFFIYGELDTEELAEAASEALARLQAGERGLAIHPRCGTNIVVAGVLTGLTSLLAWGGRGRWWFKLPRLILATTAAVVAAQPLGFLVQEHITTSPDLNGVAIRGITRGQFGGTPVHFVQIG
ncbi:MAG: hypothetical protein HYZ68_06140 [Chloroflexi bacterium]|nr:hypothetical protein [Chloroflexota bacterium]